MNSLHRHSRKTRLLSFQALESRRLFDAQTAVLVDFSYRPESNESALTDKSIFFVRDDARYGTELWVTSTTGDSPRLVVDLTPGEQGSRLSAVTAVDGGVYFVKSLSDNRQQLWWSDGTEPKTRMVADNIVLLERNYTEADLIRPLPSNGNYVYFMRHDVDGNTTNLLSGLWVASDGGKIVQRLTNDESFADGTDGGWALEQVKSFRETEAGQSVFIISASRLDNDTYWESRHFFGITDGTLEGTQLSNFAVLPLANIFDAVALSDDKVMFTEFSDGGRSRVLTIDGQGTMDQLAESQASMRIAFEKSGSNWFFSTNSQFGRVLFRTDGTFGGTAIILSAGPVHSSPVALSDGSILTLAGENFYDRDFQVTDTETLATTKLDFIVPSDGGLIREIYGSIVVGVDKFFYVETKGDNARRLTMADTQSRTVTTVFDGGSNGAIGSPVLRGNNLFFIYVAPSRTDLIQFNLINNTSVILASVATEGWQGLSIDTVGNDSLVGFMQGIDEISVFKLRFAGSKLDVISLVDEVVSRGDLYADSIRGSSGDSFWALERMTTFSAEVVINEQRALVQQFAYDTSASGLTRLLPASLPQPSRLRSGAIYINDDQPLYKAGGKVVYHSGYQVVRADGSFWHEIWAMKDNRSAQKLMETRNTGSNGDGDLIPMGVVDDRFYFLSTGPTTTLYRTNAEATAVEIVTDTVWGSEAFFFNNYQLLYRPRFPSDPQRILFRRMEDASEPGVWEIAGTPPTLTKIAEYSRIDTLNGANANAGSMFQSSGALVLNGTDSRGPLVEVSPTGDSTDRMVSFFGDNTLLTLTQQATTRLYRLRGAWVGAVPELNEAYSFWSRLDSSAVATRVSELDLSPFKIGNWTVALLDFAATSDAVIFTAGSKLIRLDRNGTYSFIDLPQAGSNEFYGAKGRLTSTNGIGEDAILGVGTSLKTSGVYSLNTDGRSFREVFVPGEKHDVVYEQIHDDSTRYILTAPWPYLRSTKITRTVQDVEAIEISIDRPDSTLSFAANRVVLQAGELTLHDSAASELCSLSLHSTERAAIVTVDIGTTTPSSKVPLGGVSIALAEDSKVRLVGTTESNITYELDDDVLTISIGELTVKVRNPRDVTVEDHLVVTDRNWSFSTGNDEVEIRPRGPNETEFVEHIRNVAIRVVGPARVEGETHSANTARWRINTRTGVDKMTVDPNLTAIALLSVVSDLDSNSALSLSLPPVSGPLDVTRQNGRTFASVSVAGLQVQLDSTRRPEHNLVSPNDADNDGLVIALDALRILNTIVRRQRSSESSADVMFGDTSGDGRITPLDALLVISHIARQNRMMLVPGEGEESRKKVGLEPPAKELVSILTDKDYRINKQ